MIDRDTCDADLLNEFVQTKGQAAFAELVRRHRGLVWAVCRRGTRNEHDAEDAAQRVFWSLARKARVLAGRSSLEGWLFRAAQNEARDIRRSNQRRQARESQAGKPAGHDDVGPKQLEWQDALDRQLAQLPLKYRQPIVLHHLQGLPHKTAAEHMGLAETTFAMRLSRARKLLQERMVRSGLAFSTASWALLVLDDSAQGQQPSALSSPAFFQQAVLELEKSHMRFSRGRLVFWMLIFTLSVSLTAYALAQQIGPARGPIKTAEVNKQVQGNTQYALDLFQQLTKENQKENIVISPYGISEMFVLAYAGARADTEQEMAGALQFKSNFARLPWVFKELKYDLIARASKQRMEISIADVVVIPNGKMHKTYSNLVMFPLDTSVMSGHDTAHTVNTAVRHRMNSKILSVVDKIPGDSACTLINALHFSYRWKHPFKGEHTTQRGFSISTKKEIQVPTMRQENRFLMLETELFQMVKLPFQGDEFSLIVIRPNKIDGLREVGKQLTFQKLPTLLKKLNAQPPEQMMVQLPKFRVEWGLDMVPQSKKMGLTDAFTPKRANFRGIHGEIGDVWISQAVHKSAISVSEEGTQDAANSTIKRPKPWSSTLPRVLMDRPFVFLLRDNKTKTLLLMGRVLDPRQGVE